jgi:hypothetical protein
MKLLKKGHKKPPKSSQVNQPNLSGHEFEWPHKTQTTINYEASSPINSILKDEIENNSTKIEQKHLSQSTLPAT